LIPERQSETRGTKGTTSMLIGTGRLGEPVEREYLIERSFRVAHYGRDGKPLELGAGRFVTSDPAIQEFLDQYPAVMAISGSKEGSQKK
jgi:hypothetical protein